MLEIADVAGSSRHVPTGHPCRRTCLGLLLVALLLSGAGVAWLLARVSNPTLQARSLEAVPAPSAQPDPKDNVAPELEGGVAWLNTAGPIRA